MIDYFNGLKTLISFDDFKDDAKLKKQVNSLSWQGDGNDFGNLLRKAEDVFQASKKSRKVFLIFVNDRLNTNLDVIRRSVRKLNSLDVKVIVIRIGDRADDQEISVLTTSSVVPARTSDDAAKTGDLAGSVTLKGRRASTKFEVLS